MNIEKVENKIKVESEFNNEFVKGARKLHGKWNGKSWEFDVENEDLVRKLLLECYGEDGTETQEKVTVRLNLDKLDCENERKIELFGRVIAIRFNRDSRVKIHDSVVIETGGFPSSGGSNKYPELCQYNGTVLRIKNVVLSQAEAFIAEHSDALEIIKKEKVNLEDLIKEKEILLARLDEIEAILALEI